MNLDMQLDAIALVRSRVTGEDEDFLAILEEKTNSELILLLNATASLTAVVIQEFMDKLVNLIPEELHQFAGSREGYLQSLVTTTIEQVHAEG